MSDAPTIIKPRTIQDVQTEYNFMCTKLGEIEYRLSVLAEEAAAHRTKIKALNQEAAYLKANEQPEPPKAA